MAFDDALDAMTMRQLEELAAKVADRMHTCAMCSEPGAIPIRATVMRGPKKGAVASLMLCMACFEKNRLPELRAAAEVD